MANEPPRRRGSLFGACVLIILGVLFLAGNLIPQWDAWPFFARYWPVLLIALGVGKLYDVLRARSSPDAARSRGFGGGALVIILLLVFLGFAVARGRYRSYMQHETKSLEVQGAQDVRVALDMPAGELKVSGGADKLLDAQFDYSEAEGKPEVAYDVSGKQGRLDITQTGGSHFGRTRNTWNLRLNNDTVRELKVDMGAGHGDLNLSGVALTSLKVDIGAGEIIANLTGDWKKDVEVRIEGGVGSATIRLPKSIGVRAHAEGGIGSINVRGLRKEGGDYVNDAYGKSPVTMRVDVQGGIGEIRLLEEQ